MHARVSQRARQTARLASAPPPPPPALFPGCDSFPSRVPWRRRVGRPGAVPSHPSPPTGARACGLRRACACAGRGTPTPTAAGAVAGAGRSWRPWRSRYTRRGGAARREARGAAAAAAAARARARARASRAAALANAGDGAGAGARGRAVGGALPVLVDLARDDLAVDPSEAPKPYAAMVPPRVVRGCRHFPSPLPPPPAAPGAHRRDARGRVRPRATRRTTGRTRARRRHACGSAQRTASR